jgi:hypothetical protein
MAALHQDWSSFSVMQTSPVRQWITFPPRTTIARQANCKAILPRGALYFHCFHQALYRAAGDISPLASQGMPNFTDTVTLTDSLIDTLDILAIDHITFGAIRG